MGIKQLDCLPLEKGTWILNGKWEVHTILYKQTRLRNATSFSKDEISFQSIQGQNMALCPYSDADHALNTRLIIH